MRLTVPFGSRFHLSLIGLGLAWLLLPGSASAQEVVVTSTPTVVGTPCPSCGRIHSHRHAPTASPSQGGTRNALSLLNAQRSRQGLRTLRYDASLQAVAERRVRMMASSGMKSHPPGSIAPGRYEGVGWSSSFSPNGVHACYTSDPNMTAAGAAMATGRDGVYFAVVYR